MKQILKDSGEGFLRVGQVIERLGISRSTFFRGVQRGIYPRGVRISDRATGWPRSQVEELIKRIAAGRGGAT